MTKEEQIGVPPMEVMRQLLHENRALVRLLSADPINHDANGTDFEPRAQTDPADAPISAYREMIELLEILSATSGPRSGEKISGQ